MRFGIAKEIITPDKPMCMIGYAEYYKKHYQAIHDDLYVRCKPYAENWTPKADELWTASHG